MNKKRTCKSKLICTAITPINKAHKYALIHTNIIRTRILPLLRAHIAHV